MIKVSGAIGVVVLRKKLKTKDNNFINKKVIVFSDNHNNPNYCSNDYNKSFNIEKLLNSKKKHGSQILLEEVKRDGSKLKELWGHSKHTVGLKNFYLSNTETVTPIDIRQYLYIISYDVLTREEKETLKMKIYLKKFIDFFNYKDVIPTLTKKLKIIIFKSTGVCNYFELLRKTFKELINNVDLNLTISNFLKNYDEAFFNYLDTIASKIMDWYTIINIFVSKKTSIIHAGLFHTSNIIKILKNDYNFIEDFKNGINDIASDDSDVKSCVEINSDHI